MTRAPLWLRRISCRIMGHTYAVRRSRYGRPELRLSIVRQRCKVCWHRLRPKVIKRRKDPYHGQTFKVWPIMKWDNL